MSLNKRKIKYIKQNYILERGLGLCGYAQWNSSMSLEVFPSSEARIQDVSLLVPSYPDQQTRYNNLQRCQQQSNLESRISEISNSSLPSMRTGGGGVGTWLGMELEDAGSSCDT